MRTKKTIKVSRTNFKTVRAGLRSHIRTDKDNSFAFSFSFIFDKTLQLIETPTIKPPIQSLSTVLIPTFSYSFKVLQYDCISRSNNLLADYVVNSTHVAFLPSRDSFKLSLSRLCAFTLEFLPQVLVLHNLGLITTKNLTIRSDSKIIYSDINTNYFLVATRSSGIDISGECDMKKQSSFSIFNNFKGLVSPIKILPIIFRNIYSNILSLSRSKGSNPNLIKGKSKEISIETNRAGFHNRLLFKFNSFKIFRSLSNSLTRKISRKPLSQILIDKMMKLKSIANFSFKSFINRILNSLKKSVRHIQQFFIMFNLNLYSRNELHIGWKYIRLYKLYENQEVSLNSPHD